MPLTGLIHIIVVLVVIGVVLWLVETYIPMAEGFKVAIRVIVILALCLFLLRTFGLW
jgi:hypothetical protein